MTPTDSMTLLAGPAELPAELVGAVTRRLETNEPLDRAGGLTAMVRDFRTVERVDPYRAIERLADCSTELAVLLAGDVGVVEGYRLHEHTQAVLGGFEADYAGDFPDPADRQLLRTILLLQDIGKSLCVGAGRSRHRQAVYNVRVARNLLAVVDPAVLGPDDKRFIMLLVGQDILGSAVKGATFSTMYPGCISMEEADQQLRKLAAACPDRHRPRLPAMMETIYLADVTAYTTHRHYREPPAGVRRSCHDTFDRLFTPDRAGSLRFRDETPRQTLATLKGLLGSPPGGQR